MSASRAGLNGKAADTARSRRGPPRSRTRTGPGRQRPAAAAARTRPAKPRQPHGRALRAAAERPERRGAGDHHRRPKRTPAPVQVDEGTEYATIERHYGNQPGDSSIFSASSPLGTHRPAHEPAERRSPPLERQRARREQHARTSARSSPRPPLRSGQLHLGPATSSSSPDRLADRVQRPPGEVEVLARQRRELDTRSRSRRSAESRGSRRAARRVMAEMRSAQDLELAPQHVHRSPLATGAGTDRHSCQRARDALIVVRRRRCDRGPDGPGPQGSSSFTSTSTRGRSSVELQARLVTDGTMSAPRRHRRAPSDRLGSRDFTRRRPRGRAARARPAPARAPALRPEPPPRPVATATATSGRSGAPAECEPDQQRHDHRVSTRIATVSGDRRRMRTSLASNRLIGATGASDRRCS